MYLLNLLRRVKPAKLFVLAAVLAVMVSMVLPGTEAALAAPYYGGPENVGYFTGQGTSDNVGGLLTGIGGVQGNTAFLGVNDVNTFISVVHDHLFSNLGDSRFDQRRVSMAYIINTMLGKPKPGEPPSAIDGGRALFSTWEARVRKYDQQGLINFNENYSYGWNTYYDIVKKDVMFYDVVPAQVTTSITFRNTAGTVIYAIKKDCANPVGELKGLSPFPATLAGVKISDSGVSPSGNNAGWGGECHQYLPAVYVNPDPCAGGSLASYPFSDDCVNLDGACTLTNNYFLYGNYISPGDHTISASPSGAGNGSWNVRGYSICERGGGCTSQWLTQNSHITNGASFVFNFLPDRTYDMRWIYSTSSPGYATLAGVKISDSGVSPSGNNAGWGGECHQYLPAVYQNPDPCAGGSLASYPFSDDCVNLDGACTLTNNYFEYGGSSLTAGSHTISTSPSGTGNGGWNVVGYSICERGASCTSARLTQNSNVNAGSSFSYTFEAGKTYDMRWIFSNTPPTPVVCNGPGTADLNQSITFTATGGNGSYSWSGDASGSGTPFTTSFSSAGLKTITVTSGVVSDSCTVNIIIRPYMSVFNGDVVSCTGDIRAFTIVDGSGDYVGSGARMAVFAMSTIDGFASGNGQGSKKPKQFSFANTGGSTFGGDFGSAMCSNVNDTYWHPGGSEITTALTLGTTNISDGATPAIYVEGQDVTITGNILYAGAGGWTNISQIPSFHLIVKGGNIYIDKGVTQLDGVYVAIEDGSDSGKIYTCTNGSTRYSGSVPAVDCGQKLTVNGSFIAKEIKFLRVHGSLGSASTGENPGGSMAEVFIYGPELWAR